MNYRKFFSLAMLAVLLSACILVDDFGAVWNEAKPDFCLSRIAQSLYYAEFNRDPSEQKIEDLARGWTLGKQHYLLLKKHADDRGGRLYRFDVVKGQPSPIFQRYRLLPTMRETFEKNYPGARVSLRHDTVSIETLDADTKKLLADIASRPEYWEVEDKTLYNTMGNPTCRFDTRDFSEKPVKPGKTRPNKDKK